MRVTMFVMALIWAAISGIFDLIQYKKIIKKEVKFNIKNLFNHKNIIVLIIDAGAMLIIFETIFNNFYTDMFFD